MLLGLARSTVHRVACAFTAMALANVARTNATVRASQSSRDTAQGTSSGRGKSMGFYSACGVRHGIALSATHNAVGARREVCGARRGVAERRNVANKYNTCGLKQAGAWRLVRCLAKK